MSVQQHALTSPATSAVAPVTPSAPRTWVRRITGGGQIIETCPTWCTANHVNGRESHLDDLTHTGLDVEMQTMLHKAGTDGPDCWPILMATIAADPYSENPARRMPHVVLQPSLDDVIENVGPEQLTAFVRDVRAHCDRLDQVVERLVQARAEYGA